MEFVTSWWGTAIICFLIFVQTFIVSEKASEKAIAEFGRREENSEELTVLSKRISLNWQYRRRLSRLSSHCSSFNLC